MDKNKIQITPLASFCKRYKISRSQLSELAGGDATGASKSTMQRLLHDEIADADYKAELRKTLAEKLPALLLSRSVSAAEIDRELLQIFDKGEYQPMINQRTILSKNVAAFFGLKDAEGKPTDPFSSAPRSRKEVFISSALQDVIDSVIDAIKYQNFLAVTGDIGSGKTVVRSVIEDTISQSSMTRLIFPETFDMNRVTPANISRAILEEFESSHIPNDAVSRAKKVKALLARLYREGTRVGLAFDEGHRLNETTLSALKNFLEMNSGGFQRYLGIVIFGQPSLETTLEEGKFREIYERITIKKMPDFEESALAYLAHRLALAGGDINELFDESALDLIERQAKTPLALGNIVNSALTISKESFNNRKVIGAAIKTKMYFASEPKVASMKKRAG